MFLLLRWLLLALFLPLIACLTPVAPIEQGWIKRFDLPDDSFGSGEDRTEWAIGGGEGYGAWVTNFTAKVATREELLAALAQGKAGDVIYVDDGAELDLTGVWSTEIPAGVTLASGRGRDGSLGGLIYTTANNNLPLFVVRGNGVRVTGLRINGPSDDPDPGGCPENARGIDVRTSTVDAEGVLVEIDNNEMWAWPNVATFVHESAGVYVHHNHIHHNRRIVTEKTTENPHGCEDGSYALGYGVSVSAAHAYIDANLFDHNRHDIASNGSPGSGYTARYNLILPNPTAGSFPNNLVSHSFDVHGWGERVLEDGTRDVPPYEAGDLIVIHHNTFLLGVDPAIVIRGVPRVEARIYQNQFVRAQPDAIWQRYVDDTDEYKMWPDLVGVLDVENNQFDVEVN